MSKAFTRETDTDGDDPDDDHNEQRNPLPAGTPNYITPAGLQRLKDELQFLLHKERPAVTAVVSWAASNGDRSENADYQYGKRRLREIDRRIRFLTKRIDLAAVVDPEMPRDERNAHQVFFGATVRYSSDARGELQVTIVGIDESDHRRGYISWISPLARALMKARTGDAVLLHAPRGAEELTVMNVRYTRIDLEPYVPSGIAAPPPAPDEA
ncbi:MAG: transcription elongation factor GreB [Gammaproteobacteria bacterium]